MIRTALIGCGGFMHHRTSQILAVKEAEVCALCDPNPEALTSIKDRYPELLDIPTFADHQALLQEAKPEAAIIATPHSMHVDHVRNCLRAGVHTLIEKPLACTAQDCRDLIEERDQSGCVAAVSYQRHGSPLFQHMREIILSKRFGKVLMLNSHLSQDWLKNTVGLWRQDPIISGGGQLNDSGSHMIDILLWITGLRAESIQAFIDNRGADVDINSVVNIKFKGGATGSLTIIGDAPIWHERHAIWLEDAALILEGDKLTIHERGKDPEVLEDWAEGRTPDANFIAAIQGEESVLAPFECGLATLELTESAWRSAAADSSTVAAS
jgi:predicted dehydrogenase